MHCSGTSHCHCPELRQGWIWAELGEKLACLKCSLIASTSLRWPMPGAGVTGRGRVQGDSLSMCCDEPDSALRYAAGSRSRTTSWKGHQLGRRPATGLGHVLTKLSWVWAHGKLAFLLTDLELGCSELVNIPRSVRWRTFLGTTAANDLCAGCGCQHRV